MSPRKGGWRSVAGFEHSVALVVYSVLVASTAISITLVLQAVAGVAILGQGTLRPSASPHPELSHPSGEPGRYLATYY